MVAKQAGQPDLTDKKTLLIHNYDLFLDRQTRLFATANSQAFCKWGDINEKRDLLLLDDLTIFTISGRRLLNLCRLVSAANRVAALPVTFQPANAGAYRTYVEKVAASGVPTHIWTFANNCIGR